ncbi:MAG: RNA methyltransferase [Anaerolineae bacterium]|nr:RNA methyltransferase [Anaerolineae bacterium]
MITSSANAKIREIRKLKSRKERDRTGMFLLEGVRLVCEAVQQQALIDVIIVSREYLTSTYGLKVVENFRLAGGQVLEVSGEVFSSIASKDNPQGLMAVARQSWVTIDTVHLEAGAIWVALDTIRDPGNLGTILRTLDAVGGCGVILLDQSCDPYDPTSIRASMGAIFSQAVVKASFEEFRQWKKNVDAHLVGTSDHEGRVHYRRLAYPNPVILVMGSEREGLTDAHVELCDSMVMIPMEGSCDSLNLAVATGVVLYEIHEQFHAHKED